MLKQNYRITESKRKRCRQIESLDFLFRDRMFKLNVPPVIFFCMFSCNSMYTV